MDLAMAHTEAWLNGTLARRAGPLADAAHGFARTRLGHREFHGGPAGLVALADAVRAFGVDGESDEDERRFVEGAGALLGLLLLEHLGDGAHVAQGDDHRVRLGRFGFFNPFSAIASALAAKSSRKELALQVAMAEAEAHTRGPISRVIALFVERLASERSDLKVVGQFESVLQIEQLGAPEASRRFEVDLSRAVRAARELDDAAAREVVARILSMLPGAAPTEASLDLAPDRLLPRLIRESDGCIQLDGHSVSLASRRLSGELSVALLVRHLGRARYVREEELTRAGMSYDALFARALQNLQQRSEGARLTRVPTDSGDYFAARTGDGLDSARLLLPGLYAELAARTGPEICVAVPHRDAYFACDARAAGLVQAMKQRARSDAARAPHRLSEGLFLLTPHGLSPLGLGVRGHQPG